MDLELLGKSAVVTGGSRGIGRAIALQLAAEGADVALVARNPATLADAKQVVAEVSKGRVEAVAADTTVDGDVDRMVALTIAAFGRIDILINCAAPPGGSSSSRLSEITTADFWEDINVKVMGYLRCARGVAPNMAENGWGRIINIGGLGARQAGSTVRSIRTAAVVAMTKNLANELGRSGINVTAIHPGLVRTQGSQEMLARRAASTGRKVEDVEAAAVATNALRRFITVEEIAYVAAFLASPKSVAISGSVVAADGSSGDAIFY